MGCGGGGGGGITDRPAGQRLLMDGRGGGRAGGVGEPRGRGWGGGGGDGRRAGGREHGRRPPAAFRCLINYYPRNAPLPTHGSSRRRLPVQISRYLLYPGPGVFITAIFLLIFTLPRVHCPRRPKQDEKHLPVFSAICAPCH